ncbi:MAG: hypothetical protein MJ200_02690 [Mycoplasmoidaceae bacterium]|nr:hypothetical protein [Mycoplasmoidaceae bacterium]
MKLKTKLISVLGATAIAASGISVISSCTYSHRKESYVMPDIRYSGSTEITTEIGQNVGTLSSFFVANRDIYHNEKFTVKAINPTTSAESTDVSAQLINVAKGFKVLITMLNVTPGQVTDAEPVSFKLTFTSTYRAKSYEIPYANTFTINYIPALDSYTATYVGDPSQTITPLTGTRDFAVTYNLNKVLQKNATISNVTTNCPDKVVVKKFEHTKGSLQIKLTLSVLSSDDYTGATETFNPIFTIGYHNTLNDIIGTTIKVEYTPLWRDINVLCYGQSIEDPDISFGTILDDNKIDIISQFHLDRVMDNDIESLEISCVDSANLVTLDSWD